MNDSLEIRIHGETPRPTVIYFPGLHGDWTLCGRFRRKMLERVRWVEFVYPKNTTWTLADHAVAAARLLKENNITTGWLLGESFGSQVMWAFLQGDGKNFARNGIILAGGFVRYPYLPLVKLARFLCLLVPVWFWHFFLKLHVWYSRRYRAMTERDAEEMLQRQWDAHRETYRHRLTLIIGNDPREVAGKIAGPLYHLSGRIDPIVPWQPVRNWLRRNCPGYVASKILPGDHNVLGSQPEASAEQIWEWMGRKD